MAVRTKKEILDSLRLRIGEQTDDETISFLEDVSDTLDDLETKATGDGEDWKTKYEENDKSWRERYKERFFSPELNTELNNDSNNNAPTKFEDLFTVKE